MFCFACRYCWQSGGLQIQPQAPQLLYAHILHMHSLCSIATLYSSEANREALTQGTYTLQLCMFI